MSLVIFGAPEQSVRLANNIARYHAACRAEAVTPPSSAPLPLQHRISTKYFDATVTIHHMDIGAVTPDSINVEGCIVLASERTSLHHNLTLPPSLLEGDHLKLFVAETHSESVASADTAKAAVNGHHDASRSERVEWALDHGFEYLEVCADSDAELTKNWSVREKDGFPRLVEAVESNMWSSMERKAVPRSGTGAVAAAGSAASAEDVSSSSTTYEPSVVSSAGVETAAATALAEDSRASEVSRGDAGKAAADKDEDKDLRRSTNTEEGAEASKEALVMDQLEGVIEKVKQQREAIAAGGMSDAERRSNAARMAMELCKLMNLGEDSDEDEDEDDR